MCECKEWILGGIHEGKNVEKENEPNLEGHKEIQ